MPKIDQPRLANHLLRALSAQDFALLAPHLEPCRADKGAVLVERYAPIETIWFLESGIGSIITISAEGHQVESGLFGREGFAPVAAALGGDRSLDRIIVQVPDDCFRINLAAFKDAISRSRTLHDVLLRYVQILSLQSSYTALSNAVHPIDERLARWLLMCHDRWDGNSMPLTHAFMSVMLAVRRPSVTTSLHVLEGNGFIRAERGNIIIRDRKGLEEFAGDSYGPPEEEYERLIGRWRV